MNITKLQGLSFKKSKGFTLVELLIALGIIGVAVIAIVSMAGGASNSSKVQTEIKNVQQISSTIKSSFGVTGVYTGLATANAQAAGAFPTEMTSGGTPVNSWNGAVSTVVDTIGTGGFDIVYAGVPQAACIGMGTGLNTTFLNMKIGATSNPAATWTSATIATACASLTANTMTFNAN